MKIKPNGFKMDFNPNNFASYSGTDRVPWGLSGVCNGYSNVTLPQEEEFGLSQVKEGATYSHLGINQGSTISMKFDAWERI